MSPSAATIVEELKAAFPQTRSGRFVPMVNSVDGDEPLQIEADFAEKDDWTILSPDWLDAVPNGLGSALSFLSAEAIRFYIPAFLVADLSRTLHRVDPAFTLVHGFDNMGRDRRIWPRRDVTWTDFACARWDNLTEHQAIAIVHYLEWRIQLGGPDVEHHIIEALANYWYPRAAGQRPVLSKFRES